MIRVARSLLVARGFAGIKNGGGNPCEQESVCCVNYGTVVCDVLLTVQVNRC
jgi:hypothetical protein